MTELPEHHDGQDRDEERCCGAFEPTSPLMEPYRCTLPFGHQPQHRAVVDGEVVAQWPRKES